MARLIPVPIPPVPGVSLTAVGVGPNQINLTANYVGPPIPVRFNFYRAPTSSGPFAQIASSPAPTIADTGLALGQTWFYLVQVKVQDGRLSSASSVVGASTQSGLITDPGFGFSGAPAFDQPLTITVADGRFGATGPLLAFFDDYRGRIIGQPLGGTAPVAGFAAYPAAQASNPIFRGVNRSGNGPAIAVLDNEVPGQGGAPFGRNVIVNMNQTFQSIYTFMAETWDGTWDGRNDNGAGGGYYKRQWAFGETSDYGAHHADSVTPVFLELTSTNQPCLSITWAAGVVTVTHAPGAVNFAPGYGPTWPVTMGTGHSAFGAVAQVPAAFSGDFTATQTSPNSFTFPLAVNPGPIATLGTFCTPGSIQGMNQPSPVVDICAGGNSNSPNTGQWFALNDTAGIKKWDQNGWNSEETLQLADPVDPVNNNGMVYMALYNTPNKQAYAVTDRTRYRWSALPAFNYFKYLQLVGLIQCTGPNNHTARRCDYYVAIGPNCAKRFFLGDASTLANCTTMMPCTVNSWSPTQVSVTLRRGAFATPSGNYIYWSDQANNIQRVGVFT